MGSSSRTPLAERMLPRWVVALIAVAAVGGGTFAYLRADAPEPPDRWGLERDRLRKLVQAKARADHFGSILQTGPAERQSAELLAALDIAFREGDAGMFEELIRRYRASLDRTALNNLLHMAVVSGDTRLTKALLDAGASPDLPIRDGRYSPLGLAITSGNLDVIRLLLAAGANWDAKIRVVVDQKVGDRVVAIPIKVDGRPIGSPGQIARGESITLRELGRLSGDSAIIALMKAPVPARSRRWEIGLNAGVRYDGPPREEPPSYRDR